MAELKPAWYFTFGRQYASTPHPRWARAHPDGAIEVRAKSFARARDHVFNMIGTTWSDVLEQRTFEAHRDLFSRGVLDVWDVPDFDEIRVSTPSPHALDRLLRSLPSTVAEVVDGSYDGEICTVRVELGLRFARSTIVSQGYGVIVEAAERVIERPQMACAERFDEDHVWRTVP